MHPEIPLETKPGSQGEQNDDPFVLVSKPGPHGEHCAAPPFEKVLIGQDRQLKTIDCLVILLNVPVGQMLQLLCPVPIP